MDWIIKGAQSVIAQNMGATGDYIAAAAAHESYWKSKASMLLAPECS